MVHLRRQKTAVVALIGVLLLAGLLPMWHDLAPGAAAPAHADGRLALAQGAAWLVWDAPVCGEPEVPIDEAADPFGLPPAPRRSHEHGGESKGALAAGSSMSALPAHAPTADAPRFVPLPESRYVLDAAMLAPPPARAPWLPPDDAAPAAAHPADCPTPPPRMPATQAALA